MCKPKLENAYESVLEFIEKAKDGFETEITAVAIPEVDIQNWKKQRENSESNLERGSTTFPSDRSVILFFLFHPCKAKELSELKLFHLLVETVQE